MSGKHRRMGGRAPAPPRPPAIQPPAPVAPPPPPSPPQQQQQEEDDSQAPAGIRELAERRARARARRDFAAADQIRAELEAEGWEMLDRKGGYDLRQLPPYRVFSTVAELPDRSAAPPGHLATVALLVDGWPDDLRECIAALLKHAPADVRISALDIGNSDGAGDVLHELAEASAGRIEEWHVAGPAGWGAARNALLRADTSEIHVIMDTSVILQGDALTPLLTAASRVGVVAAGWRGADPDRDLKAFHDAGPGGVTALFAYLMAVRTDAARDAGGLPAAAKFYRNADLEFSLHLGLRGALVVPQGAMPARLGRHRGYYESDPAYRDSESAKNYRRVLALLRHK